MSRLWYEKPAKEWEEALPIGNGRMGAMIFGGIREERIQVNEESVWYGGPVDRINPDALKYLKEIREYIFENKIEKAQKLMNLAMAGCPESMHPYQTLGDITLRFEGFSDIEGYERNLDLEDAVSRVRFISEDVLFEREMFLSCPDDCIVMHFTADKPGRLTFHSSLSRARYFDKTDRLAKNGVCLCGNLGKGGFDFAFGIRAWTKGGCVKLIGDHLCIEEADEALLLFSAATSYRYGEQNLQKVIEDITEKAASYSYFELKERHKRDYRRLFERVDFQLEGAEDFDPIPTDERIFRSGREHADIGLSKLLFDFGRYLMISCSRPGGLPATLQGIWNQEFLPPWESKYTININTEMNYWPAESCNLSECHLPLFELLHKMMENGKRTARKMYGCRGFVAHHNTDIHGDTAPQDVWVPGSYWVMGAAWLCTHIWTHYQYTLDEDFLRENYSVMCEAALFFLDFLVEKDGYLVTCPSSSPENSFRLSGGESGSITFGVTMDNQILRDLFTQCLEAGKILHAENIEFQKQVEEALSKLAPTQISSKGTIMEWMEEYEECEPGHRHISHLYGLHPSEQITMDGTPQLAQAAKKTLEERLAHGGGHTGWSRAWIINHYARLWDGEKAYQNLEELFAISIYPNLFDRHPPFQIDGNFGATAAIAEMLVQSNTSRIVLLPALPSAWKSGSISGLRIKGNAEISMQWEEGSLTACEITAFNDFKTTVLYKGQAKELSLPAGEKKDLNWGQDILCPVI